MVKWVRKQVKRLGRFIGEFRYMVAAAVVAFVVAGIGGLKIYNYFFPELPDAVRVYDFYRLNLPKTWTDERRQWYYHTSQGSQVMPYDWFVALEQADNDKLFIDNEFMSRMRFVPDPNPIDNPDFLPIGFAKDDPDPVTGVVNAGLTCAACHTAQITYKGLGMRIDGAPGQFNFDAFLNRIVAAVGRIALPGFFEGLFEREPTKFTRFAQRVLKDKYNASSAAQLKKEVREWLAEKVV
jgi:hypothetical protein